MLMPQTRLPHPQPSTHRALIAWTGFCGVGVAVAELVRSLFG